MDVSRVKNTSEEARQLDDLELTMGILTRVDVFTRPGHAGLLRLRVMDELTQVVPSRAPQYVSGNGETHTWTGRYPLKKAERQLQIWAWNLSTQYTHGCKVGLTVQAAEEVDPLAAVRDLVAALRQLIGV